MNADSKSKVDLLNRKEFADEIAKGVISAAKKDSEGFVIGLTGKWGSGKSTLLDFVKEEIIRLSIENNIKNEIIDFNPWMFTDSENIKKAFLKEIANKMSGSIYTKIKKRSSLFAKAFQGTTKVMGGDIANDISAMIQKYLDNDTSIYLKDSIDKALIKSGKKLFIFIDDIDRLLPKQIFEILQVLKLSGNFKNTYYIVAFDREAVEISIESQFKDYGRKYLDKIIQADFLIPEVAKEKIEEIFFDNLVTMLGGFNIHYNTRDFMSVWSYRGFRNYFSTLRDIYRYFNSLKFRLPSINANINITDFLIIEAIRLYDFVAYEKIYQNYSFSIMSISSSHSTNVEDPSDAFSKRNTKLLIAYLFPGTYTNTNQKRLHDPNYFDRYFTLKLNLDDIGEADLRIIIEENQSRNTRLLNLIDNGRLKNLLRRLNDKKLIVHYPNWEFNLINDLFVFFNDYAYKIGDLHHEICDSIMNLLVINEKRKAEFLEKFLSLLTKESANLSAAIHYFNHFIILSEKINTGFANEYYYFKEYYKLHINKINEYFLNYLIKWKDHYLKTSIPTEYSYLPYHSLLFIYDFATYFKDEYIKYANELLKNKKDILFYLYNIVSINAVDDKPFKLNMDTISILLPGDLLEIFTKELKKVNAQYLNEKDITNRDFFLLNHTG